MKSAVKGICLVFVTLLSSTALTLAEELSDEEFKKVQTRVFEYPPMDTLNAMHAVCRGKDMDPFWPYDVATKMPVCLNPNPLETKNLKRNKWFLLNDDVDYVGDPIVHVQGRLHPKTERSDKTTILRVELDVIEDRKGFLGSAPTLASTRDPKIYQGFFDAIQIKLSEGLDQSDVDGDW